MGEGEEGSHGIYKRGIRGRGGVTRHDKGVDGENTKLVREGVMKGNKEGKEGV